MSRRVPMLLEFDGAYSFLYSARPGTPAELDPLLVWPALGLLMLGLVMVYSASIATAEGSAFTGHQPGFYLVRHGIFLVIGLVLAVVAFQIPLRFWQQMAPLLFLGGVMLLVAVLVPGVGSAAGGAACRCRCERPRLCSASPARHSSPSTSRRCMPGMPPVGVHPSREFDEHRGLLDGP